MIVHTIPLMPRCVRSSVHPVHRGLRPLTRVLAVLVVLSPLALAVPALVHSDPEKSHSAAGTGAASEAPSPLPARQPNQPLTIDQTRPITGFAINAHHIADLSLYLKSVDEVARIGANAL